MLECDDSLEQNPISSNIERQAAFVKGDAEHELKSDGRLESKKVKKWVKTRLGPPDVHHHLLKGHLVCAVNKGLMRDTRHQETRTHSDDRADFHQGRP